MSDEDWNAGYVRSLAFRLAGDAMAEIDEKGRPIVDDTLLILLNAYHEPLAFTLPAHKRGVRWQPMLDTSVGGNGEKPVALLRGGAHYELESRSIAVLRLSSKH
jgi:glycogen operon protein